MFKFTTSEKIDRCPCKIYPHSLARLTLHDKLLMKIVIQKKKRRFYHKNVIFFNKYLIYSPQWSFKHEFYNSCNYNVINFVMFRQNWVKFILRAIVNCNC